MGKKTSGSVYTTGWSQGFALSKYTIFNSDCNHEMKYFKFNTVVDLFLLALSFIISVNFHDYTAKPNHYRFQRKVTSNYGILKGVTLFWDWHV